MWKMDADADTYTYIQLNVIGTKFPILNSIEVRIAVFVFTPDRIIGSLFLGCLKFKVSNLMYYSTRCMNPPDDRKLTWKGPVRTLSYAYVDRCIKGIFVISGAVVEDQPRVVASVWNFEAVLLYLLAFGKISLSCAEARLNSPSKVIWHPGDGYHGTEESADRGRENTSSPLSGVQFPSSRVLAAMQTHCSKNLAFH
jgi:hypothetical protein